jgi:hypothetical protein
LAILRGGAQGVVGLDVGVEVGADAEGQGAGRLGGGLQHEVDEQARVVGAAAVLLRPDLARLGQRVEFLPLVNVEKKAGGALVLLDPTSDPLRQRCLTLTQKLCASVELGDQLEFA